MKLHGYRKDDDSFIGGATFNVLFANDLSLFGHYDTELHDRFTTNVVGLGARWTF